MNIFFLIYHSFLVSHFPQVRQRLLGDRSALVWSPAAAGVAATESQAYPQLPGPKSRFSLPQLSFPQVHLGTGTAKIWALNGVIAIAILVTAFIFLPDIYYKLVPADTAPISSLEVGTPRGGDFKSQESTTDQLPSPEPSATPRPLPVQDNTLPEGEWIIISRIGVRTQLQATEDVDQALATGVWMAPDYGRPGSLDMPVIAAAHRYGWQWWWKDDYWKYHSFYLLPDLQPGDIVETISNQRKYYYEVYAGEEGDEITDYSADLILYTCKFLNSPVRHFRYARLVDMDKSTQTVMSVSVGE